VCVGIHTFRFNVLPPSPEPTMETDAACCPETSHLKRSPSEPSSLYMMFSLKSDSNVYTHINLAPCRCVHRKMQDGSTTSPIGSKCLPRRTISLKADSVLTRYSFQSQRRHQGVWGRRRFNQTVVVMFAASGDFHCHQQDREGTLRSHSARYFRYLQAAGTTCGPRTWGRGICNMSHVFLCCAFHQIRIWVVKSSRMGLAEHVAYMGKK
jgi:hypothetical protein